MFGYTNKTYKIYYIDSSIIKKDFINTVDAINDKKKKLCVTSVPLSGFVAGTEISLHPEFIVGKVVSINKDYIEVKLRKNSSYYDYILKNAYKVRLRYIKTKDHINPICFDLMPDRQECEEGNEE